MSPGRPPSPTLRALFRTPVCLYRLGCGWLLGHRFLMLIHIGRRTGRRRFTVLEVIEYRKRGPEAVVLSGFGRKADWLRNIRASPSVEVVIGIRRFAAAYRFAAEAEAVAVLTGYLRRNRVIAPVIRRVLSRLLGWAFDGSEAHCRRLAAELPLVVFHPQP